MKKWTGFLLIISGLLIPIQVYSQKRITLEDIFKHYRFQEKNIPGFNFLPNSKTYTLRDNNEILLFDLATGEPTGKLVDFNELKGKLPVYEAFEISPDEHKLLLATKTEKIYRRSKMADYFIYDKNNHSVSQLYEKSKQVYPGFSPDNESVAFVSENNLYIKNLKTGKVSPITTDGQKNKIINGMPDWVYEEEFKMLKAYQWSPDGHYLAYLRFDETLVPEYTIDFYNDADYPEKYTYKYPKVGARNSVVSVYVYSLLTKKTRKIDLDLDDQDYIPLLIWTRDMYHFCITRLNRLQNELKLYLADAHTGKVRQIFKESSKTYIDINNNLSFLNNGSEFLMTSEKNGYKHLYLYDLKGTQVRQLTQGNWDVTKVYGIDQERGLVYYQAAKISPTDRQVYRVDLNGDKTDALTNEPGNNDAQFSSNFEYFVLQYSNINRPSEYKVCDNLGKQIRALESNAALMKLQKEYNTLPVNFFQFTSSENILLNGWTIMPPKFDTTLKYPVFMFQYSGPNSAKANNTWIDSNYWWFQMLAQNGYIVACVDGRGTAARGEAFRKVTYLQLGKYETIDQIETAGYFQKQSYVDPDRIGIYGWSYGGFISSLCILKGNDVFKSAIAVAPVTNWKWYDSVYTERYMQTEKENEQGYKDNSPVNFADRLKGKYLLIHGMADDNVHVQNSNEMASDLIKANKQFDCLLYPNKNHSIFGGNTRLHLYTKMTDFIYKNL